MPGHPDKRVIFARTSGQRGGRLGPPDCKIANNLDQLQIAANLGVKLQIAEPRPSSSDNFWQLLAGEFAIMTESQ